MAIKVIELTNVVAEPDPNCSELLQVGCRPRRDGLGDGVHREDLPFPQLQKTTICFNV